MNKAKDISSLDGEEEEEEEEDKTLSKKDYENFVNPGAPEEAAADHSETGPGGGGDQKENFTREGRFGSSSSVLKAKTEEAAEALKKTVEDAITGSSKSKLCGRSKAQEQCGKLQGNVESSISAMCIQAGSSGQRTGTPGNTLDKNLSFCGINLYVNPLEALRRKTI
ncbi:unnamed protein product [Sphagnum troendelagicum]